VGQGEVSSPIRDENSMTLSGLSCRKALVGNGCAISFLLCMNVLRKRIFGLAVYLAVKHSS